MLVPQIYACPRLLSRRKLEECYFMVNAKDLMGRGHSVFLNTPLLIANLLTVPFKHI